nr:MAG TPA: hypothetical protein [Caudoviricetes sp.]
MVLNVVGSSPISHPKERGISVMIFLFFAIYQAFGRINPKRCRKEPHYFLRYCCGDSPVCFLKNVPK